MERDSEIKIEFKVSEGGQVYIANDNGQIQINKKSDEYSNTQQAIKSRTQEYADKWDTNMFLNDFKEWDENAGINVKLSDVYLEEHLPHFIGKHSDNKKINNILAELNNVLAELNNVSAKLKKALSQYINKHYGKKMLLILGQPGIGKSTLITWITANFKERIENILVYQFSTDLQNIDWENKNKNPSMLDDILKELNLSNEELAGKTLIIDGFDEISIGNDRADILNRIYWQLKAKSSLNDFSLIITCRENYIQKLWHVSCEYIILQPWDEEQIRSFCTVYSNKTECKISEKTIMNILKNKEVLGIPLILYMVLALSISIEKESSIVDVYDKVFAIEGGIYDRCIDYDSYADLHWISEVKKQIHQISREIAFWMFENNPDEVSILQKKYYEICDMVIKESLKKKETIKQDLMIGSYFKRVRHCDGIETEKIYFIHRSIYEYFVAEMIYNSIRNEMIELSEESQKKFSGNISWFLKQGELTHTITEFLQHKILKLYDNLNNEKKQVFYQWWENAVGNMMNDGMFYYTKKNIQNLGDVMRKELQCFQNLVKIYCCLCNINENKYIMTNIDRKILEKYIRHCSVEFGYIKEENTENEENFFLNYIDFNNTNLININLKGANLAKANLEGADLTGANLTKVDLEDAKLVETDLTEANLTGADLERANLTGANLTGANLTGACLRGAKLRETKLRGAKLRGTDLRRTNLKEANLVKSNLSGANLSGADLTGINLTGVNLVNAVLRNVDLIRANIEASIWRKDDIQQVMPQLREIEFEHIIIEDENGRKEVSKKELFPELQ